MVKANWNKVDIPKKIKATYKWSAPHAIIAHEGRTTKTGLIIPARPWTTVATEEYDFKSQFVYNFNQSHDFKSAFVEVANEFGGVMQDAIASPIWEYPRTTVRQNGEVVSSPRNIVDTRELYDSYSMEVTE